jgi:NAD(P)-dependent dehydrogenase (short-subunit alcohol dehydrogenase family)
MSAQFSLNGKSAVVTGGSRGLGAAIALGLAEAGADVLLTYRERHDEALAVVRKIEALGRKCAAVPMDVTDRLRINHAVEQARNFGPIAILVNNAGINKPTDFDAVTDADWDAVLDTNLKGPFMVAQAFLPLLKEAGGGSIIHIGSVSGQYGGPRTAHYAASKAGLISLGQVIARFGAVPDRLGNGRQRNGIGRRAEGGGKHHPETHGHAA